MATITATAYGKFLLALGRGAHNLETDVHRVALLTGGYTPDYQNHGVLADVTQYQITDDSGLQGGYATGGLTLSNKTWTYDAASKSSVLSADAIGWTSLTGTVRYAVIYRSPAQGTLDLIGCIDFGAERNYPTAPFQLSFSNGVIKLTS